MPKRHHLLSQNQSKVKVIAQAHPVPMDKAWFVTLAAFVAGVFYFFGYYFWGDVWRVLAGG